MARGGSKWNLRICPQHLRDETRQANQGNILPFSLDPICQGQQPGRNAVGDAFHRAKVEATSPVPRTSTTSRAAAASSETTDRITKLEAENRRLQAKIGKLERAHVTPHRPMSWKWLLDPLHPNRTNTMVGLTRLQLHHWIDVLDTAGAGDLHLFLHERDHPRSAPALPWRDALSVAMIRVWAIRNYTVTSEFSGVDSESMGECALRAAFVVSKIYGETWSRPYDVADWVEIEKLRVNALKGEFNSVDQIIDGLKGPCQCLSQAAQHRAMHSSHTNMSCFQISISVNQAFEPDRRTRACAGSWGESTVMVADGANRDNPHDKKYNKAGTLAGLRPDREVMTDKGHNLVDHLRKEFHCKQIKPTECSKAGGAGMSEHEGSRSTRLARPRATSERAVSRVKQFDYCHCAGNPIRMEEWAYIELWLDLLWFMIKFKGPFPDHPPETVEDEMEGAGTACSLILRFFLTVVGVSRHPHWMSERCSGSSFCHAKLFVVCPPCFLLPQLKPLLHALYGSLRCRRRRHSLSVHAAIAHAPLDRGNLFFGWGLAV